MMARGMVDVGAEHAQVLLRGFHVHLGFLFGVLRHFQIFLRDARPCRSSNLGAVELRARQRFIGDGVAIVGEGAGEIGALHAHQKLAFGDGVAQIGRRISTTRPDASESPARCARRRG